jgi:hypothetical protein
MSAIDGNIMNYEAELLNLVVCIYVNVDPKVAPE